jgi:hypothetical protein
MSTGVAPRSPFASSSWEPRFVVEHYDDESLGHAVELWRRCSLHFPAGAPIRYVAREPTCLQVAHPGSSFPVPRAPWEELEQPVVVADVPALVRAWLETATYPDAPSFDGAEAKGYCVYWAYFLSEEAGRYRSLVVLPKWFEIHK